MSENAEDLKMPITAHLVELRKRFIICSIAVIAGFAISYYYSDILYRILSKPLIQSLPAGYKYLVFTGVVEPFLIYLKVGFIGGVILASPVIAYQMWSFGSPALYRNEKRWFVLVVVCSIILFISGILFAYLAVFPFGFAYLLSFSTDELRPMVSMGMYFSMAMKLMLAFGAVFQLPLVILVLARIGIVTGGQLISWWRYAVVLILVIAAILTPTPDIFTQLLMAGPLVVLYGIGVMLAIIFGKKNGSTDKAEET